MPGLVRAACQGVTASQAKVNVTSERAMNWEQVACLFCLASSHQKQGTQAVTSSVQTRPASQGTVCPSNACGVCVCVCMHQPRHTCVKACQRLLVLPFGSLVCRRPCFKALLPSRNHPPVAPLSCFLFAQDTQKTIQHTERRRESSRQGSVKRNRHLSSFSS